MTLFISLSRPSRERAGVRAASATNRADGHASPRPSPTRGEGEDDLGSSGLPSLMEKTPQQLRRLRLAHAADHLRAGAGSRGSRTRADRGPLRRPWGHTRRTRLDGHGNAPSLPRTSGRAPASPAPCSRSAEASPAARAASRIASISAWALASCVASTALPARASSAPSGPSTTAPTGISPRAPAARASSSAIAIPSIGRVLPPAVIGRVLPPRSSDASCPHVRAGSRDCHGKTPHRRDPGCRTARRMVAVSLVRLARELYGCGRRLRRAASGAAARSRRWPPKCWTGWTAWR